MITKLTPTCKDYIWGGKRLKTEYGKESERDVIAETWELSCHKDGASYLEDGTTLADYIALHPEAAGTACAKFGEFPVLIKLIDAAGDLSIQVHPDDTYAKANEGQLGKTEMWYVLDCAEGASLYYGFEKEISKEELAAAIEGDTLCDALHKVYIKKGDCFFIKAGTVHAIGAGTMIAEVQQSSNVTYRVYDYGRVGVDGKARELHVEKACAVAERTPAPASFDFGTHIAQCEYFTVDKVDVENTHSFTVDETSFYSVLMLDGSAVITCEGEPKTAAKGDSFFIAAGSGAVSINGKCSLLMTYEV